MNAAWRVTERCPMCGTVDSTDVPCGRGGPRELRTAAAHMAAALHGHPVQIDVTQVEVSTAGDSFLGGVIAGKGPT